MCFFYYSKIIPFFNGEIRDLVTLENKKWSPKTPFYVGGELYLSHLFRILTG